MPPYQPDDMQAVLDRLLVNIEMLSQRAKAAAAAEAHATLYARQRDEAYAMLEVMERQMADLQYKLVEARLYIDSLERCVSYPYRLNSDLIHVIDSLMGLLGVYMTEFFFVLQLTCLAGLAGVKRS